jgi:hypothetical protein
MICLDCRLCLKIEDDKTYCAYYADVFKIPNRCAAKISEPHQLALESHLEIPEYLNRYEKTLMLVKQSNRNKNIDKILN